MIIPLLNFARMIQINDAVKWISIIFGSFGLIGSILWNLNRKNRTIEIIAKPQIESKAPDQPQKY
jgi:hypothetical protein